MIVSIVEHKTALTEIWAHYTHRPAAGLVAHDDWMLLGQVGRLSCTHLCKAVAVWKAGSRTYGGICGNVESEGQWRKQSGQYIDLWKVEGGYMALWLHTAPIFMSLLFNKSHRNTKTLLMLRFGFSLYILSIILYLELFSSWVLVWFVSNANILNIGWFLQGVPVVSLGVVRKGGMAVIIFTV